MSSTEFIKMVDHASAMNDRWLFLAAFCLLLLMCGVIIFWLVKQLQGVIQQYKTVHEEHHDALDRIITIQNETALKLALCIDHNTAALHESSFELRRFQERH